jgi:hypothetical protein
MKGLMKKMIGTVAKAIKEKETASAGESARRKDNMAGMAIEAKKGGLMKKGKMEMAMKGGKKVPAFLAKSGMADKTGRAVKRKTADVKGRAMKGK